MTEVLFEIAPTNLRQVLDVKSDSERAERREGDTVESWYRAGRTSGTTAGISKVNARTKASGISDSQIVVIPGGV